MISGVALVALGLLAGEAGGDARIQAFGEACLATTPVSRDGLAALARRKGWPQGQAATPDEMEWRDYYRAGEAIIHLDQHRVSELNPGERICVVLVGPAPSDWVDQVSHLQSNGQPVGGPGSYDTQKYVLPPDLELVVWDLPDGSRIHALKTPDDRLELSVNYPVAK
jgi:hypothetical protein